MRPFRIWRRTGVEKCAPSPALKGIGGRNNIFKFLMCGFILNHDNLLVAATQINQKWIGIQRCCAENNRMHL